MTTSDFLQVVLAVQLMVVTALFLSALRRSATQSRRPASDPVPRAGLALHPTAQRQTDAIEQPAWAEGLVHLEEQRSRLLAELTRMRASQVEEERVFRARRREVVLDLHEHRRIATALTAAEPELRARIAELHAEVEHLERRQPELEAEIRASTRSSIVLHGRVGVARRELDELQKDRARIASRVDEEMQRLRDLARRRVLLLAETEELATIARGLQRVNGGTRLLSQLTDGELRDRTKLRLDARTNAQ